MDIPLYLKDFAWSHFCTTIQDYSLDMKPGPSQAIIIYLYNIVSGNWNMQWKIKVLNCFYKTSAVIRNTASSKCVTESD